MPRRKSLSGGGDNMNNVSNNEQPQVYKAVRAVGIFRPKFQPNPPVKIFADSLNVIGTAFWLKDYKVLITCAHVVQGLLGAPIEITGLLVIGNRGNYMRASIDLLDFSHDLAVLRLAETPKELLEKEASDGLEITENYPNVGENVAYAGFPLGLQLLNSTQAPTYSEGVVGAQLRHHGLRKEIQITGAVIGGFSGAPIVSKKEAAKLIGVLSSSPSQDAGKANIFMAISWEHVKTLAESTKL